MNMKARSKLLLPLSLTALLAGGGVLYSQHGTPLGTYAQAQSEHTITTTNCHSHSTARSEAGAFAR